jgi:hypothetical protein
MNLSQFKFFKVKMMKELFEYTSAAEIEERREKDYIVLRFSFLEADKQTLNKRRYSFSVLSKAIEEAQADIARGAVFGSSAHRPQLELDDVSHVIQKLEMQGKLAVAEVKVLPTQRGKNLQVILKHGRLGVSARGVGSVKVENGEQIVGPDYKILGVDFVTAPASGMMAGQENIIESAGAEAVFSSARILDQEKVLMRKYDLAISAGYKGDWTQFRLMEENKDLLDLFNFARRCGFKGTFEDFVRSRRR